MNWYLLWPLFLILALLTLGDIVLYRKSHGRWGFIASVRWFGRKVHKAFYGKRDATIAQLQTTIKQLTFDYQASEEEKGWRLEDIAQLKTQLAKAEETGQTKSHAVDQGLDRIKDLQNEIERLIAQMLPIHDMLQARTELIEGLIYLLVYAEEVSADNLTPRNWYTVRAELQSIRGFYKDCNGVTADRFEACRSRAKDRFRNEHLAMTK